MKQILILTHGELANGFKDSVRMIAGEVPNLTAQCVSIDETIETVKERITAFIASCDPMDHKVILTDIPGGSTTQAAFTFINTKEKVHVVAGINLGLVLEIVLNNDEDIESSLHQAVENGKETLNYLNETFGL